MPKNLEEPVSTKVCNSTLNLGEADINLCLIQKKETLKRIQRSRETNIPISIVFLCLDAYHLYIYYILLD